MEKRFTGFIVICCLAGLSVTSHTYGLETRADPTSAGANSNSQTNLASNATSAKLQKLPGAESNCGSFDELARRVDGCAKPLMDLLQGSVEKWPRTDEDAMQLCNSFQGSEKCIRDTSRKCGKGIQKTIISTLAHSIARARKRECSRAKAPNVVKTTMCLEKNQDTIHNWMSNVTGRLSAIELQTREADKKINAVCCMVGDIGTEIKAILDPLCPGEGALVNRLYRAVLQDVIELICRNPKCNNYLKGYKINSEPNFSGLITILLRIVFSLDHN